jgi:hypothetical protein
MALPSNRRLGFCTCVQACVSAGRLTKHYAHLLVERQELTSSLADLGKSVLDTPDLATQDKRLISTVLELKQQQRMYVLDIHVRMVLSGIKRALCSNENMRTSRLFLRPYSPMSLSSWSRRSFSNGRRGDCVVFENTVGTGPIWMTRE